MKIPEKSRFDSETRTHLQKHGIRLPIVLILLIFMPVINAQKMVPLSDTYIQDNNLTAGDLKNIQVFVKFVNSRIYQEPVSSPGFVNIGNIRLDNLTPGAIISTDFKPVSNCKMNVDFGNNTIVQFFHNAGDNVFYTFSGSICLMLFTPEVFQRQTAPQKGVTVSGLPISQPSLQQLIDNAPDNSILNIPEGNYVSDRPLSISGRNFLTIVFSTNSEILCNNLYEDVINIFDSKNIKVVNGRFRHIKITTDQCSGSVFYISQSQNITLEKCDINGCGIIGVSVWQTNNITVRECYIHDNRYSAYSFSPNTEGIKLISNRLSNNPKYASWDEAAMRSLNIVEY